jgi:hypothetical protein
MKPIRLRNSCLVFTIVEIDGSPIEIVHAAQIKGVKLRAQNQ